MPERISIRQIAQASGFSRSTVSLALREDKRIMPETRAAIRKVAQRLGYVPDPLLSALAQERWRVSSGHGGHVIAVIHHLRPNVDEANRHLSPPRIPDRQIQGIRREAARRGYRTELFNLADYPNGRALGRVLHQRGIRGLILAPMYLPMVEPEIEWGRFSVVSLNAGYYPLPFHTVTFDPYEQVMFALGRMVALGYRRIGLVLIRHLKPLVDDERRHGAAQAALYKWAAEGVAIEILYQSDMMNFDTFTEDYLAWWRAKSPEGVLGFHLGHYHALTMGPGLSCPREFRFASLHVEPGFEPVSGVPINDEARGVYSVYLLDLLLRGGEQGRPEQAIRHYIGFTWQDAGSLPPLER